jgi:hypothetical protein
MYFFFIGQLVLFRGFYIENTNKNLAQLPSILTLQYKEKIQLFTFGSVLTEGFSKIDSLEKPFFIQKFIHNYQLEIL